MDHEYYRDWVSAYVDGALPAYEQMALEEHIAKCAECRALLEKLRKLEAMVQETSVLSESDYWEQQAQKIEARLGLAQTEVTRIGPARSWRGLGWKLTAAAASIVVMGVIGFYSWESIREKTNRPPAQMAPSLPPASVVAPQKIQPVQEKADEAKKAQVPTKEEIPDTQNYKRPAVGEKPATSEVQETVNRTVLDKTEIATKEKPGPVQRVDDLLKGVAGVKGDSAGVWIRGGRRMTAAESAYLVESPPMQDPVRVTEPQRRQSESLAVLRSETTNRRETSAAPAAPVAAEIHLDSVAQSAPTIQGLAYWQAIRDSLSVERSPIREIGKSIVRLRDAQPSSLASGLVQKKDSANRHDLLLEAYFRIAQLSKDSTETRTATDYLQKISEDAKSPYQKLARAYLDSLNRR